MITTILHAIELALALAAWRIILLWFRPVRPDGRVRLGGSRVSQARAAVRDALSDWLGGIR